MVGLNALPLVEALQPAEIAGLAEGALLRHTMRHGMAESDAQGALGSDIFMPFPNNCSS